MSNACSWPLTHGLSTPQGSRRKPLAPPSHQVFQSAANMADTYYWYTYLQRPTDNHVNDFIMDQYEVMHRWVARTSCTGCERARARESEVRSSTGESEGHVQMDRVRRFALWAAQAPKRRQRPSCVCQRSMHVAQKGKVLTLFCTVRALAVPGCHDDQ